MTSNSPGWKRQTNAKKPQQQRREKIDMATEIEMGETRGNVVGDASRRCTPQGSELEEQHSDQRGLG